MATQVLRPSWVLAGEDLQLLEGRSVIVEDGKVKSIEEGDVGDESEHVDLDGSILMPGFINAHTHLGDSAFQDIWFGKTLDELFKPPTGLKHALLESADKALISAGIRSALIEGIRSGVTTIADFRESGEPGLRLLQAASHGLPVRVTTLARPAFNFGDDDLRRNEAPLPSQAVGEAAALLRLAEGFGISSPNELTDPALKQLAEAAKKFGRLKAIHVAEDPRSSEISLSRAGMTEPLRAIKHFEADLLVHCIHVDYSELVEIKASQASIVCCPRSNATLRVGFPKVDVMLDLGLNVALGTDNLMVNSLELFREMEFLIKAYSLAYPSARPLAPIEVLKMATVNGAKALKIDGRVGSIEENKIADLVALDFSQPGLKNSKDLLTALTCRAGSGNIRMVMVGGKIVNGTHLADQPASAGAS